MSNTGTSRRPTGGKSGSGDKDDKEKSKDDKDGEKGDGADSEPDDKDSATDKSDDSEKEGEKYYEYVAITSQMKAPSVRSRLGKAREETDKNDRTKITYYVSEFRGKGDDGSDLEEEVKVPEGREYLRFARPTAWSEPVRIDVKEELTEFVAGDIEASRALKFNDKYIDEGEPTVEIVTSVWSKDYNSALPSRRTVRRADALDFPADIHVLNSVTWRVHEFRNAPILTNAVVVDMLGGGEIPLPRRDTIRYRLPSEVLIMKADGTFTISNDLDDKTRFKQLLLEEDDPSSIGGEKAARRRQKEYEDRNRRGGGRGGEFGGGGDF